MVDRPRGDAIVRAPRWAMLTHLTACKWIVSEPSALRNRGTMVDQVAEIAVLHRTASMQAIQQLSWLCENAIKRRK